MSGSSRQAGSLREQTRTPPRGAPRPAGRAYTNLRLWDGLADSYVTGANSIVIDGDVIAKVGVDLGGVDCRGLTVLPGLIDAHVHMTLDPALRTVAEQLAQRPDDIRAKMAERAAAMLRAGITTARDLGGGAWLELELRDRINAGDLPGPRLLCAGQPVTSVGGHCHFWGGEATSLADAEAVIARQAGHRVDLIKLMATGGMQTPGSRPQDAQFDQATTTAIVAAASARGFAVAAHCHGTPGIRHAANAGVATIEHCSWLGADGRRGGYDPELARAIAARGIWVSPTVNVGWARFGTAFAAAVGANFQGMKAAGCRLVASTDAGIPGVRHQDLPRALPVFARLAGLSAVEALRAATSDAAAALGLGGVAGVIQPGASADLLFVRGDPLADLGALASPAFVVARGREIRPSR